MYYVFKPDIVVWNDTLLYANLIATSANLNEFHEKWWTPQPIDNFPHGVQFAIESQAPRLDHYNTGSIYHLYSQPLLRVIREAGVAFESFPVSVVDKITGQSLPDKYELFHLLEEYPALDLDKTQFSQLGIEEIVLAKEFLESDWQLTRISQYPAIVLIHASLKDKFDELGMTGCKYTPVEEYGMTKAAIALFGHCPPLSLDSEPGFVLADGTRVASPWLKRG